MRYFNTSGPCNPAQHYTVLRQALVAEGMEKVRPGRYLTIFAPRQSGKTTFFRLLAGEMFKNGQFTPIQISFENLKTLARDRFYEELDHVLGRELTKHGIKPPRSIYVGRRGYRAFDTKHLREGAWHYSLDGFINFFIERLGGHTLTEVPSGRGRTDILILYRDKKYIIETKIFTDLSYFEKGKRQLAAYANSEGLPEGYYVVFSNKHSAEEVLEQEEMIEGKRIITRLIHTKFERPSRKRKRKKTS